MSSPHSPRRRAGGRFRPLSIEPLENRVCLSGQPVVAAPVSNAAPNGAPPPASAQVQNATALVKTMTSGAFSQAVQSINDFALDLYQHYQQQPGNLFLSPLSIATALAMTYAGAEGQTAVQMADVLHLSQPSTAAQSYQALLSMLNSSGSPSVALSIADALWLQEGYPFQNAFLQLVQSDYGGAARNVDYASDAAGAEQTINAWVAAHTDGKITNLFPPGALSPATVLTLTNAIYFDGQWATAFDAALTSQKPFYLPSGQSVDAPLMYSDSQYSYSVQDGYQVLDLPYQGGTTSMVVLLPQNTQALTGVSASTLTQVNDWLNTDPGTQEVIVRLPKFQMTVSSSLNEVLAGMGMPLAFEPGSADFSGMSSTGQLYINEVLHQAFVQVDEQGTQAAAATGVGVVPTVVVSDPVPPIVFTADHAFQFYIRDNQTGTILFMGRMTDPLQQANNVTPTVGTQSTVTPTAGPMISQVGVNLSGRYVSWNEADPAGLSGGQLSMIDGNRVSQSEISGPYTAASGVNYAGIFGTLSAGPHTYVITATDALGNVSTQNGSFTVPVTPTAGPVISQVGVNLSGRYVSWNEADPAGLSGGQLSIDGIPLSESAISGPYTAASAANYAGIFGTTLSAGTHTYVITATDALGNVSTRNGSFTVPVTPTAGPVISQVGVNLSGRYVSWNEADPAGLSGGQLSIDGTALSQSDISGPYTAASGVNYVGIFGTLSAGPHTYVITATDKLGNAITQNGSFTVPAR